MPEWIINMLAVIGAIHLATLALTIAAFLAMNPTLIDEEEFDV
jgi:hypothetical protein